MIKIYNASAGSGKTFALTQEYLTKIIASGNPGFFKYLLAITFTNKAVNEMKNRIIDNLFAFADETQAEKNHMFALICSQTGLSAAEVRKRAQQAVVFLLNNYSYFDVETIDKFNHRLIRTFARDLQLSSNFKVEIQAPTLVADAVDRVIARVGKDELLTQLLIGFMIENVQKDKSWDLTNDLNTIGKLLISENQLAHIHNLQGKTIHDFEKFKTKLLRKIKKAEETLQNLAGEFFKITQENNFDASHFKGKYAYNYFQKLQRGEYPYLLKEAGWHSFTPPIYPARITPSEMLTLDRLTPTFKELFDRSKEMGRQLYFYEILLKNVNSLSLLNSIREEFIALQKEQNVLPISEFNQLINNQIKDQPAPFIYERLGEKYRHFLIDEFQDTSQMQWHNLVPLIDNSLSQAQSDSVGGSLFLVGDAKQAIYRFRGGFPEQFMRLYARQTPFSVKEMEVSQLDTNYRSRAEIISFNNQFFSHSANMFAEDLHRQLYLTGNNQKLNSQSDGFVSVEFVEANNEEEKKEVYPQAVLETIREVVSQGYLPEEITLLVRTNKMAVQLADYLTQNGMEVSSAEALLIAHAPQVQALLNVLKLIDNFQNQQAKADLLAYLYTTLHPADERHVFIKNQLNNSTREFEKWLDKHQIYFDFENAITWPVYELCEEIIRQFIAEEPASAHLVAFLEMVFEFTQQQSGLVQEFLDYWQLHQEAAVDSTGVSQGVRLMTVHKAKGLEFPVVIYPYAEETITFKPHEKIWHPLDPEDYEGFSEMLVPITKSLEHASEVSGALYHENLKKLQLDVMNVVYVAHTRATEQLYIITNIDKAHKPDNTAFLYKDFLEISHRWTEGESRYTWGNPQRFTATIKKPESTTTQPLKLIPKSDNAQLQIATSSDLFWDTTRGEAIEKGNRMHAVLAKILYSDSLETVLHQMELQGEIDARQRSILAAEIPTITEHPELKKYYQIPAKAVVEQEIFIGNGQVIRPDRINFLEANTLVLIDYKTGSFKEADLLQMNYYTEVLNQLGYEVVEKLLVYLTGEITVKRV